ncbi:MAG: hypothetical protein Q8S33_37815 [Myxococcales bacterium]|nr:hypothetical protein [Myxococcales bacterium]
MVVLLGRRTGTSVAEGGALTAKVASALSAHGVSVSMNPVEASAALKRLGFPDASRCSGQRACLVELGRQLGVAWVVSVSVTSIKQERSVGVELIAVADGSSPEKDAVLLLPKAELTPDLLASFASRVKNRWTPIEQPPPMVALAEPTVALEVSHPVELPTPPAPEPRTQAASWVLGGAGLAALVASGVLLGSALVTRGGIYEPGTDSLGRRVSSLTFEEATARNMQANTAFIFSAALGALAAVLGLTAVVLW